MNTYSNPTNVPIIVLGGGISGLSVAWFLKKAGFDFRLIEKEPVTGGKIRSEVNDETVFDHGPNSIRDKTGIIQQLIDELSLTSEVIEISESYKTRFIVRSGKLSKIGPGILSTLSTGVLSSKGKMRLLKEPFISAGPVREESVGSFLKRRFGEEAVDYLADPVYSGIYAGNINRLSKSVILPGLAEMEHKHGSVLKGSIKSSVKKESSAKKGNKKVLNFKKGIQELTDSMSSRMHDSIVHDEVLSIEKTNNSFKIKTEHLEFNAEKVISCLPANALANILHGNQFNVLSHELGKVQYAPILTTHVVFRNTEKMNAKRGFGFLVPQVEDLKVLGAIWKSSIFPQHANKNNVQFTLMSGGANNPDVAVKPIIETEKNVLSDFNRIMGVYEEPIIMKSYLWKQAIPQFNVGFQLVREKIASEANKTLGLSIGANFMWGVSVPECVEGALDLVRKM